MKSDNISSRIVVPLSLAVGFLTILSVSWLAFASWRSVNTVESVSHRTLAFERLAGQITFLEEVLASSARLMAGTGDKRWEERYYKHNAILVAAISSAIDMAGVEKTSSGIRQAEAANKKLFEMEQRAFDLVSLGKSDEALALLNSPAFDVQEALYKDGMGIFINTLESSLYAKNAADRRAVNRSLMAAIGTLVFVIFMWYLLVRIMYRQQIELKSLYGKMRRANSAKSDFLAEP